MLAVHDIIFEISKYLTDKEKILLSMTLRTLDKLKYKFIYYEKIDANRIMHLSYFDNFECVEISNPRECVPKNAKYIYFETNATDIPYGVTHLTFGDSFDEPIDSIIPLSVTHLSFGSSFDQSIKNNIPSSVTCLTFKDYFNKYMRIDVPRTVINLTIKNDIMIRRVQFFKVKYRPFINIGC